MSLRASLQRQSLKKKSGGTPRGKKKALVDEEEKHVDPSRSDE